MCQCVMYASPARSIGVAGKFPPETVLPVSLYINKAGEFPRQLGLGRVACYTSVIVYLVPCIFISINLLS